MALGAAAFPILPGKTDEWRTFIGELNGSRRAEYEANRKSVGVRERAYYQPTPMGDLVILTLEGDDPAGAFSRLAAMTDPFSTWFFEQVQNVHGFDIRDVAAGPMPQLVVDSASK
jgi:hypothetical protein